MDKIVIEELRIFARHGVFEFENEQGQYFYVNAVLYTDTEKAGMLDELECSTDYGSVCALIEKVMTENTYKLIETAAQSVAEAILLSFGLVRKVDIEIRKPEAPIKQEFGSVSVRISRGWHDAVIALGSNMGDSRKYIEEAVRKISENRYIRDVRCSGLIVTKPYGYTEQADFLNGALICRTMYSPHALLHFMQKTELEADRRREIHWGPRTLDLDMIFYDGEIISDAELTVPHPDVKNRRFVLGPVKEIAPYYWHPVYGMTVAQLYAELEDND